MGYFFYNFNNFTFDSFFINSIIPHSNNQNHLVERVNRINYFLGKLLMRSIQNNFQIVGWWIISTFKKKNVFIHKVLKLLQYAYLCASNSAIFKQGWLLIFIYYLFNFCGDDSWFVCGIWDRCQSFTPCNFLIWYLNRLMKLWQ